MVVRQSKRCQSWLLLLLQLLLLLRQRGRRRCLAGDWRTGDWRMGGVLPIPRLRPLGERQKLVLPLLQQRLLLLRRGRRRCGRTSQPHGPTRLQPHGRTRLQLLLELLELLEPPSRVVSRRITARPTHWRAAGRGCRSSLRRARHLESSMSKH